VSSQDEQRQQKIPLGSRAEEGAVHTRIPSTELSDSSVQPDRQSCEMGDMNQLMDRVAESTNLLNARKRVEKNKGAPGIDNMTVAELPAYFARNEAKIRESLINGSYRPQPVKRIEIPKGSGGGVRKLGIPSVVDRVIQQAILQILTPIFEPTFSESSYGFRPGRSAHQAVTQALKFCREGLTTVVDIDLEDFFNRVNHDILMSRVARKVKDKSLLKLIRAYLEAGIMINGCKIQSDEGVPQGGPLSPLMSNIMLDDLDKELESRGHKFARYADDCNVYVGSQRSGERVFTGIKEFLENHLKLKVNSDKSAVDKASRRKFLGFSFMDESWPRIKVADQSVGRFKNRLRELTCRTRSQKMSVRITAINVYLKGWIGYYRLAQKSDTFDDLDSWIKRRLRQCRLKEWKRPKTRFKRLRALGQTRKLASKIATSGKGTWRLARTPQLHAALSNAYWHQQGLLSLRRMYFTFR
jgi:group II intron reverse transcriptase/maturase